MFLLTTVTASCIVYVNYYAQYSVHQELCACDIDYMKRNET